MIEITAQADFKPILRALDRVENKITGDMNWSIRLFATRYLEMVRLAILNQTYANRYKPAKAGTTKWEAKKGFDPRFWIMTGKLISSLRVWKAGHMSAYYVTFKAGIPGGVRGYGGREVTKYGLALEFGVKKTPGQKRSHWEIPPRPVFGPTLRDFRNKEAANIGVRILKNVSNVWR